MAAALARRRAVLEQASAKDGALEQILQALENRAHLLVYVSAKNIDLDDGRPPQIQRALAILRRNGIGAEALTGETNRQRRRELLGDFGTGAVPALVAMKILDEGVNVPATQTAILMASSTSRREWVQRRGRVLRTYPGKEKAVVYDIAALPPSDDMDDLTRRVVDNEIARIAEFAGTASNDAVGVLGDWCLSRA